MSMRLLVVMMIGVMVLGMNYAEGAVYTWSTDEQFGADAASGESISVTTMTSVDTAKRRVRYTVSSSQGHAKVVLLHVMNMWQVIHKPFNKPVWTGASYNYMNGTMYSPYATEVSWPGPEWGYEVEYDFLTNAAPNNDATFVFGYDYKPEYGIDGASLPEPGEDGNLAIVFRYASGGLPVGGDDEEQFFGIYIPNFVAIPEPGVLAMLSLGGLLMLRRK
ncbi:PEP-CTERM sorting domain-containing protein [Planctomycetota bacterium]|nr:PEP-CTERM sorting domain-containing protein [Planctomycetota bacterium]